MDGTARVAAGLLVCGLLFCAPAAAGLEETVKKHRDAGAQMVDWIEARVNDDVITHREYEDRVRLAAMELSREPNSELRQAVLRQMVEDLLILQLAQKENIVFPDEQLAAQVDRMVAAAKARFPSEEEFWKYLERSRLSPEAYRADLAETLRRNAIITRMQRRMVEGIVVTASDVEKFKAENPTAAAERDKTRIGLIQLSIPEGATPEQEESVMLKARTLAARLDAGDDFSASPPNTAPIPAAIPAATWATCPAATCPCWTSFSTSSRAIPARRCGRAAPCASIACWTAAASLIWCARTRWSSSTRRSWTNSRRPRSSRSAASGWSFSDRPGVEMGVQTSVRRQAEACTGEYKLQSAARPAFFITT
ncbi:SurA N-terminal domain-containing protein [bacterium]|nr:SurA N-terminal domain-containing protein [bacterium]